MANPITYRMWVPQRRYRADLKLRSSHINHFSVVHVSASEASRLDTVSLFPPGGGVGQTFEAKYGYANITVQNVTVGQGIVKFRLWIDWHTKLDIVCDITVFDPPVEVIIGR
jgi:hypothetical protein